MRPCWKRTGRNTILVGTAIPQKVGTPVAIAAARQIIRPKISLSGICYTNAKCPYPVAVKENARKLRWQVVSKNGFSTFELLSDSRKGTVAFDNGVGERSYSLEQMAEALPTVSKDGAVFKGWKINGTLYTTVNEALLDALNQAKGHRVTAQAVLESTDSGSQKGDSSSGSGSDGDTD